MDIFRIYIIIIYIYIYFYIFLYKKFFTEYTIIKNHKFSLKYFFMLKIDSSSLTD